MKPRSTSRRPATPTRAARTATDPGDADLMSTPGLAESYLQVMQDKYDEQMKSGTMPPRKAREVKAMMRQFRGEMTGIIVRRDLLPILKQTLRLKNKARLSPKDMALVEQIMKDLPRLEKLLKEVPKPQRQMLEPFLAAAQFDGMLLCERRLVQLLGKAGAKDMLAASGIDSPSEAQKQAKRRRLQTRRPPRRKP